jgi:Tfp pilus assembly protein PilF
LRLAEARDPARQAAADIGGEARQRGFERLNANRLGDAASDFEAALARDGRDADALGGLGVVRLRQGRVAEARQLLERAVAAVPERGAQWRPALEGASYGAELAEARAAMKRQDRDAAEAVLRRAVERDVPDRADAEAMLGELALRRGDHAGAEARFRAALARRPDFGAAALGLRDTLKRQNRSAEAAAVALPPGAQPGAVPAGEAAPPAAEARVAALREEAARAADPAAAAGLLRAALAEAPGNPWVRLDLARVVLRQGRGAEARTLMQEQIASSAAGRPSAEAAHAAALFADEDGRPADAAALIERVEPRLRSSDMARLLARARALGEVRSAAALGQAGNQAEARQRLIAIAARRGAAYGTGAAAAVRALAAMGDVAGAAEAARAAQAAGRGAPPAVRLALASAMLDAGMDGEAGAIAAEVSEASAASAEDRRQAAAVQSGLAIRAADRLNEGGDRAAAYDRLLPVLARDPQDAGANLALARLHQGHRQPEQARAIARPCWRATRATWRPGWPRPSWPPRRATGGGRRRCSPKRGRCARPTRACRCRKRGSPAPRRRAAGRPRAGNRGGAAPRPARRGARVRAAAGAERRQPLPRSRHRRRAARVAAGPHRRRDRPRTGRGARGDRDPGAARRGRRVRSGTAGLDKLQEVSATAEASTSVAGGRLAVRATPVALSNGDLPSDAVIRRRFGTNALAGPGVSGAARDTTASGVAVGMAYTSRGGGFSADVGTTPLGFRSTEVVGGVQVAPLLSDNLRLRLTAERRAITDSLLSWAGTRDGRTGQTWGGVTRTGAHGQLEYTAGPATFYAGGGWSTLDGDGVASNTRTGLGAGGSYAVFRRPEEELTVGADLVYFAYDKNLRHFTLGHGGYFSPQSYAALNLPVDYRARSEDLSWRLGATIGVANWREEAASCLPRDGGLQRSLEAAAAGDPTLQTRYPGRSETGLSAGCAATSNTRSPPRSGSAPAAVRPRRELARGPRLAVRALPLRALKHRAHRSAPMGRQRNRRRLSASDLLGVLSRGVLEMGGERLRRGDGIGSGGEVACRRARAAPRSLASAPPPARGASRRCGAGCGRRWPA